MLEQMFITFHDKSLFAVSIYVSIAVHEIYQFTEQFMNIAKHCGQFFLDCTLDLLGKLQLFFKSLHSVKAIFELFTHFSNW